MSKSSSLSLPHQKEAKDKDEDMKEVGTYL